MEFVLIMYRNLSFFIAAARESELLDEMNQIKQAKDMEKKQMVQVLAGKDKAIADLTKEVELARADLEGLTVQVTEALENEQNPAPPFISFNISLKPVERIDLF